MSARVEAPSKCELALQHGGAQASSTTGPGMGFSWPPVISRFHWQIIEYMVQGANLKTQNYQEAASSPMLYQGRKASQASQAQEVPAEAAAANNTWIVWQ